VIHVFRKIRVSVAIAAVLAALTNAGACRSEHSVPSVDRITSEELLSPTRALPPIGFPLRPITSERLSLTKSSEGWYPYRYNDAANYCTVGYGHLIKKFPCDGNEPREFLRRLSSPRGEEILLTDMVSSRYTVMTSVDVDLSEGQFAALSDFVFNVGSRNFQRSTLLKVVNSNQDERIPGQFRRWIVAAGKTLPGLVRRREREIDLYFEGRPKVRAIPLPGEDLSPIDILSEKGTGK
jgi:GH24 family phage-related lysozyme (muramidase)